MFLKHLVDDCMFKFQVCYLDRLKVFESIIKSMIHSKEFRRASGYFWPRDLNQVAEKFAEVNSLKMIHC